MRTLPRRHLGHHLWGLALFGFLSAASSADRVSAPPLFSPPEGLDPDTNWASYGHTYSETRYSTLAQINSHNVSALHLSWWLDLPGERTLEATPLAVDGVLYFSSTHGTTFAVDAKSGRQLWRFVPEFDAKGAQMFRMNFGWNRGVAYWQGKVYVGTVDGHLIALDSRTGALIWSTQTFDEPGAWRAISGPPRVFNGKVIIGHGGGDAGTRGYVTAYDAETGKLIWRFHTVPGASEQAPENAAMAEAAHTWSSLHLRQQARGGAVWDSVVYDPDFNRIYIAVGNGHASGGSASGVPSEDQLFLCSIVALQADTGAYVWHYQITPGDIWDYDATQQIVLADLPLHGQVKKVLMQASKNGFFYVLDRATGRLLSAEKYTKVTWAERVNVATGRPIEAPHLRDAGSSNLISPSFYGAHNWQPMSFNPLTGLVYIPTTRVGMRVDITKTTPTTVRMRLARTDANDGTGGLLAWDPIRQTARWEVVYKHSFWNGGTMTTAGNLVFQGTGLGQLLAYDARAGNALWTFDAGLGIIGAPITYAVNGIQYVSILVGYGGAIGIDSGRLLSLFDYGWRFSDQPRRLLTFSLDGRASLPKGNPPRYHAAVVDDPSLEIDRSDAAKGAELYALCVGCHGPELKSVGSFAPDLRESALALHWQTFKSVVHGGLLERAGMPRFDSIPESDLRSIFMYIRQTARKQLSADKPPR